MNTKRKDDMKARTEETTAPTMAEDGSYGKYGSYGEYTSYVTYPEGVGKTEISE